MRRTVRDSEEPNSTSLEDYRSGHELETTSRGVLATVVDPLHNTLRARHTSRPIKTKQDEAKHQHQRRKVKYQEPASQVGSVGRVCRLRVRVANFAGLPDGRGGRLLQGREQEPEHSDSTEQEQEQRGAVPWLWFWS